jgi:hypothetical protein
LKHVVEVDFYESLAKHVYDFLQRREVVLLDSNTLITLSRESGSQWLRKLLLEWRKYGARAVCGVCDFIKRESVNAEKWRLGEVKVQGLLSGAAENPDAAYVEVKTPIMEVEAESRDKFADVLPKAERRRLIKNRELSGTDKCLILVAWHMQQNGLNVSVATEDAALARMCGELSIKVRRP